MAGDRKVNAKPGDKWWRLTLIEKVDKVGGHYLWLCRCDCGNLRTLPQCRFVSGHTKSCGCYNRDSAKARWTTHGESKTAEFFVWAGMLDRCYRKTADSFRNYGGRGITVCGRWRSSFSAFIKDVGHRPSQKHTIERINNDLGYYPGNVRWATRREQSLNQRRIHRMTYGGITLSLTEWAERFGVGGKVLNDRINRLGWSFERAVMEPVHSTGRRACA